MIELKPKSITLLVAHPDDEIIFGFGVLPYAKKIICCSNDKHNIRKPEWNNRYIAIKKVCEILGVELINLDYNSNFWMLDDTEMFGFEETVKALIENESLIFTHNAWGEYMHRDHILLHDLAIEAKKEIITSDIMISSDYTKFVAKNKPVITDGLICKNNISIYNRCKRIYRIYNGWTWGDEPFKTAIYYIEKCKQI